MSLWLREHPASLFGWEPTVDRSLLQDFSNSFRQLDRYMREMEHNISDIDRHFNFNLPVNMSSRQAEAWHADNPIVTDKEGNRKLQLRYDVRQFKPEEISIKTKDGRLEIHAKHEESTENSKVYREYHRSFTLPNDLNLENLKSSLNRDGILTIEAPLPALPEATTQERTIAIEHLK